MHDAYDAVNVICAVFPNLYAVITWTHTGFGQLQTR